MSEKPKIIESVPGMEPLEVEDNQVRQGRVIRDIDFRGDPTKVLGHPNNPNTEMHNAYVEHIRDHATVPRLGEIATHGTQIEVEYNADQETRIDVTRQ